MINIGTQIRKSPYFSTVKWGATGTVIICIFLEILELNKTFGIIEKAILCDVAVERQVEIQMLTNSLNY